MEREEGGRDEEGERVMIFVIQARSSILAL